MSSTPVLEKEIRGTHITASAVAPTQFQTSMNDCVARCLSLESFVYRKVNNKWEQNPLPPMTDLDAAVDYRIDFRVRNNGSEVQFKNVQISVHTLGWNDPETNKNVDLYKDATFTQKLPDHNMDPLDNDLPADQYTPIKTYYFRVIRDYDTPIDRKIFGVGIYAEVVPYGHAWLDVNRRL